MQLDSVTDLLRQRLIGVEPGGDYMVGLVGVTPQTRSASSFVFATPTVWTSVVEIENAGQVELAVTAAELGDLRDPTLSQIAV